jgi:hypothetical protein
MDPVSKHTMREVALFVTMSHGTPAVHNLVTIDTGSSLSLSLFASVSTLTSTAIGKAERLD